jgi:hypothetical protein
MGRRRINRQRKVTVYPWREMWGRQFGRESPTASMAATVCLEGGGKQFR